MGHLPLNSPSSSDMGAAAENGLLSAVFGDSLPQGTNRSKRSAERRGRAEVEDIGLRQRRRPIWGTFPPKFEVGDGLCIGPPNILRSSVVGWARKFEESKKIGVAKEFFVERGIFVVEKGSYSIHV